MKYAQNRPIPEEMNSQILLQFYSVDNGMRCSFINSDSALESDHYPQVICINRSEIYISSKLVKFFIFCCNIEL